MAIAFYSYPKCGTCRKAKKWLDEEGVSYEEIHLIESPPTKNELEKMLKNSGLESKKFFNTSGMKYRELGLKDRLSTMSEDEKLDLLASDGMLIKRPLTTDGNTVTVGFKEAEFAEHWKA